MPGVKSQTKVDGPWSDKEYGAPQEPLDDVEQMTTLYPWQQTLINKTEKHDTRSIHVVIDPKGYKGKSSFSRYITWHKLGSLVPPMNCAEDILQFCMCIKKQKRYIIDMPRAMPKKHLQAMYAGIESLKNGVLYDKRYKGVLKLINHPNIIVFTNQYPDKRQLSRDRWRLWSIKDNQLVKFNKHAFQAEVELLKQRDARSEKDEDDWSDADNSQEDRQEDTNQGSFRQEREEHSSEDSGDEVSDT